MSASKNKKYIFTLFHNIPLRHHWQARERGTGSCRARSSPTWLESTFPNDLNIKVAKPKSDSRSLAWGKQYRCVSAHLLPAFWASSPQQWSDALSVTKMESQILIPHVHRVTCRFWDTMGKVKKDKPEQTAQLKYNPFWSYPSHVFSRGKGMISRYAKLFNLEWHPVIRPGTQEKKEAMASTHQKSYISPVLRLWLLWCIQLVLLFNHSCRRGSVLSSRKIAANLHGGKKLINKKQLTIHMNGRSNFHSHVIIFAFSAARKMPRSWAGSPLC